MKNRPDFALLLSIVVLVVWAYLAYRLVFYGLIFGSETPRKSWSNYEDNHLFFIFYTSLIVLLGPVFMMGSYVNFVNYLKRDGSNERDFGQSLKRLLALIILSVSLITARHIPNAWIEIFVIIVVFVAYCIYLYFFDPIQIKIRDFTKGKVEKPKE